MADSVHYVKMCFRTSPTTVEIRKHFVMTAAPHLILNFDSIKEASKVDVKVIISLDPEPCVFAFCLEASQLLRSAQYNIKDNGVKILVHVGDSGCDGMVVDFASLLKEKEGPVCAAAA